LIGVWAESGRRSPIRRNSQYAVGDQDRRRGLRGVSAPQPKNDNDGRQKTDRDTGAPLHVTELVAMDDTGAEVKAAYLTDEQAAGIAEHAARLRTRAALGRAMGKSEGVT
jgi:hypothetical protein